MDNDYGTFSSYYFKTELVKSTVALLYTKLKADDNRDGEITIECPMIDDIGNCHLYKLSFYDAFNHELKGGNLLLKVITLLYNVTRKEYRSW